MFLVQALVKASQQYYVPNVQRLLEALSGIVFLGCPHPSPGRPESWPFLGYLLKTISRLPKLVLVEAELEMGVLVNTCSDFEEAGFEVEVISAYETIETQIRTSLWRSRKSVVRKNSRITSF
jgi:hypothetical protein